MAYTVDYSDSTKTAITVNDGTVNTTTDIGLVGKNYFGYGETIAENFLHLLENFANGTAPSNPTEGQLWLNNSSGVLSYYHISAWVGLSSASQVSSVEITDTSATTQTVTLFSDQGNAVAVVSNVDFTIASSDPYASIFIDYFSTTDVKAGITLAQNMKFHGTATSAEYADLAEMYTTDAAYEPGTVVKIGGEAEVTQTTEAFDPEVFGVVSTDPAYLMNSQTTGVAVALEGRVPCKVIGQVRKGQRLVSSEEPGVARAVSDYERQEALDWYRIVGRALADKNTEGVDLVEIVVGTK